MKTMRMMMSAVLMCALCNGALAAGNIEKDFQSPPDSAKPSAYWWWFNSLVDKDGITRDLEEFKAKGIGSVTLICSGNDYGAGPMPRGPVFLSPEWRELYKHTLKEANRLGLEVGVNFGGGGWDMGGAWIKPEYSSRWYVQSHMDVTGPQKFSGPLPAPGYRDGYDGPYHGNVSHYMTWPKEKADYRDTAVVAFRGSEGGGTDLGPERGAHLAAKSNRKDGSLFLPRQTAMDQTLVPWMSLPGDKPVRPEDVVDLTSRLKPDGTLDWEVPAGRWTILRTGHVLIGCDVRCVLPEVGYVLEVDWFNPDAVDEMFANLGKILIGDAGPLAGKTLKYFHTDSFEDGFPNWTGRLLDQFKHYRGYDPTPYLPVFAGKMVGSAEISDRFLYDYRKTMADCMADGNYGRFAERSRQAGLEIQCQAGGPSWSGTVCMDALKNLGRCDRPMGEFWQDGLIDGQNMVCKQTAIAAHIYGRRTASAEAFTGGDHWVQSPWSNKPVSDRAFCEGINRLMFHTMTCTRLQDGKPGYEYGCGTHFNPNVTWWQQAAGPWLSYVNRCQALLQSGLFVADVLYYNGDWAPNLVVPKHVDPSLGKGYDYDVCNAEVLLTRLSVKNGRIVLPDGMSYRLLVLPERKQMPVEVIEKIKELVKAGATIVGPRPESDPGLKNYPQCDTEVKKIAAEMWGGGTERIQASEAGSRNGTGMICTMYGKGRVITGKTLREVLLGDGVTPDFEALGQTDAFIDFIHRATPEADFYFLVNRKERPEKVEAIFRQSGRQSELWNPVSGEQRDLPQFTVKAGRTSVPLEFEPYGSMFVVFRRSIQESGGRNQNGARNFLKFKPAQELAGPWEVQFDPSWFYPTNGLSDDQARGLMVFDKLEDWSRRPEEAVRNFSGTATYRKTFSHPAITDATSQISKMKGTPSFIDLGTVKETARVTLNGKDLGVVWCAPWRVEITGAIKPGENKLEIEVVNLWPNRLIGDSALPAEKQRTRTNINQYKANSPRLSSGLLGPVTIQTPEQTTEKEKEK